MILDTQPRRERPPNRRWGEGPGSAGGVAHVPAALRDAQSVGKNRRRIVCGFAGVYVRKLPHRSQLRGRDALVKKFAVRSWPVQILLQEGGSWTPWRHLPLHIPLVVVSPTSRSPRSDGSPAGRVTARQRRFGW